MIVRNIPKNGSKRHHTVQAKRRVVYFRHSLLFLFLSTVCSMSAQEVLLPVRHAATAAAKEPVEPLTIPFFDDFSSPLVTRQCWQLGGTFVNDGYAPLPPTRGMATLDAFDADGHLYPTATDQTFSCDTLTSLPIRLDSLFVPYARPLTPADSIYLSFFYLPGGGYGNMWERVGDCPESADSLVLEFYDATLGVWEHAWSAAGVSADTLLARTGSYWQFCELPVTEARFLNAGFRFRFRNYCSLSNLNKTGIISNADQWNVDYVLLDASRCRGDSTSRDVAFVLPAPSLLARYQAMPSRQFNASEMAERVTMTITNRYREPLATDYRYQIYDMTGRQLYEYDGGYENIPVFWDGMQYQTSPAHAQPPVGYTFPLAGSDSCSFAIVHHVREGVSGDIHTQNDSTRFVQHFADYYAYDDGVPENGYGLTSTSSRVGIACRFRMNVEDTLTAIHLYFNRTLHDENAGIGFVLTVWDDADGHPGNIIYQDANRRKPLFEGFNRYVSYALEEPLVCSGTIYVGFEQYSSDYINLGFDRGHDASSEIFYRSGSSWQNSILRGALMLRPHFGTQALLSASRPGSSTPAFTAYARQGVLVVELSHPMPVQVFDAMGRQVCMQTAASRVQLTGLPAGLYLVRVGTLPAKKLIVH